MTVVRYIFKPLPWVCIAFLVATFFSTNVLANVPELLAQGDSARLMGDYSLAEKAYAKALAKEPDNYRILKSLVEVKVVLEKYGDAKPLAEKILSREVTLQKKVKVFMQGQSDPLEAELVDETVVIPGGGKTNMKNYLDTEVKNKVSYYRLFFLKSGKMELIPKNEVRIEYIGIPRLDHEMVQELYAKIQMKLIDAAGKVTAVEMVPIEGGCFKMGSDKHGPLEQPVHEVCVSSFQIEKYEVTQESFQPIMGTNPSRFVSADLPVESVTWQEANSYCKKVGKRLPTEAEWEFAARGGTTTKFYWGDTFDPSKGNFCDAKCDLNIRLAGASDGYKHTAPVGSFPPNPPGLYDMSGNVAEWVADWMHEGYYIISPKDNPLGPKRTNTENLRGGANEKIFRGGSWETGQETLRSSWRKALLTDYRIEGLGFRCAADI